MAESTPEKDARIFLDSNVILSGLMSSKGAPRIILDLLSIEVPLLKGTTGQYNLEEIERNLSRRFPDLLPIYRDYFSKMRLEIIPLPEFEEILPLIEKMSPKDAPVLVSAQKGEVGYLITGNKKDFPKELLQPVILVSPADFLSQILPEIISKQGA